MLLPTVLLLSLAHPAPALSVGAQDDLPEAEALLDARDARFAAPEVRALLASFRIEGRATFRGIDGTGEFVERYGPGARSWFELSVPGLGDVEQGFDGEHGWDRDPRRGPRLGGPEVARQARVRHGLQAGRPWRELYESARSLSRETIEGREVVRIELSGPEGAEWWFVDPAELLLVRHVLERSTPTGPVEVSTTYGDWRPVEGVLVAHRRATRAAGQFITREVERVRLGEEFPEGTFDLPLALRRYLAAAEEAATTPVLVEQEARRVLATRTSTTPEEFGATRARMRAALIEHLSEHGGERSGPWYVRYLGFGPDRIDLECGVQVEQDLPGTDVVATIDLPAGPALTLWHEGAYEDLPATYGLLEEELARRELRRASAHYELFWVDDLLEPDPAAWRTQIVVPVEEP